MTRATVEVPAELREPVRETVLLLYQATAESLHQALRAGDEQEAHSHRGRVDELDALVRALGGEGDDAGEGRADGVLADGSVRLTAPRDLLHDVLYGALIDAGERLAELSGRGWRGERPAERIEEAAGEVLALHALLGRLG
jgi:hypothetical protein